MGRVSLRSIDPAYRVFAGFLATFHAGAVMLVVHADPLAVCRVMLLVVALFSVALPVPAALAVAGLGWVFVSAVVVAPSHDLVMDFGGAVRMLLLAGTSLMVARGTSVVRVAAPPP